MGKINLTRVLLGGLLAGLVLNLGELVLNGVILAEQWIALVSRIGLSEMGTIQTVSIIMINFLVGVGVIWMYAAIRPRFGVGLRTAVIAGLTLWAIGWLFIGTSFYLAGVFSAKITFTSILWGLFEVPIAAIMGAWLYREDDNALTT